MRKSDPFHAGLFWFGVAGTLALLGFGSLAWVVAEASSESTKNSPSMGAGLALGLFMAFLFGAAILLGLIVGVACGIIGAARWRQKAKPWRWPVASYFMGLLALTLAIAPVAWLLWTTSHEQYVR